MCSGMENGVSGNWSTTIANARRARLVPTSRLVTEIKSGPPALHRHPKLDTVIWRVHEILFGPEVPLRRLHRRVAQEQLDLLQFPTCRPTQLGAATPQNVWRDS